MKTIGIRVNFLLTIVSLLLVNCSDAQKKSDEISLSKTVEKIVKYNFELPTVKGESHLTPVGRMKQNILYEYKDKGSQLTFYLLDEDRYTFDKVLNAPSFKSTTVGDITVRDSIFFFKKRYTKSMEDYGYSQLSVFYKGKTHFLDSIFNADKKIKANFSNDNKFLIVSTLNTLSDYYNSKQDDKFRVFAIDDLKSGKVTIQDIPCVYCAKGDLINNKFFFTKSNQRDDLNDGFAWTDIYSSLWGKIQDSTKIASFSDIVLISPDGKYILAKRTFDLKNGPLAIIDVKSKKYQLLIGRDYSKAKPFYSFKEKKFAFDFGGIIAYIDFPKEYPFDALIKSNKDIPSWTDKNFYKQLEHPPFNK